MSERTIFMAALDIDDPAERWAFLDESCRGDAELRKRVAALIHSHEQSASFLNSPPPGIESSHVRLVTEVSGDVIGPYSLLKQIGEGGFGVVFLAEQERPIKRRVALKVIKPGMDTRQVIARFEAERQALAMMDHPNIAKVHDARATENGRPYFVMELVQGIPITEYCDQRNLTTRERLELFVTVCQAVQHAHQKGVIHRDIKPTNVLVAMQDGRPTPKIIDFGVAKAIDQPLTDRTLTNTFAQMVGTPLYMSPEQAELTPLGVDTRSDIYSLGVMLYELLTGATPFDKDRLHAASYDEMRRIIREEEPPRPSARISTLAADLATTVAGHRHTDARRLSQLVRGELEWIVMKCLEKDRNRRYETPSSLAHDIERFLNDEPVQACPPSKMYRLRKYARRNKVIIAFMAILVAASVFLGFSNIALKRERDAKTLALARANAFTDFLQKMLYSSNPDPFKGSKFTIPELMDDFSTRLGDQLADEEAHRLIRRVIDEYGQVAVDYPNDLDRRVRALTGYVQTIGQCLAAKGFEGEVDELNRRLDKGLPKLVADFGDSNDCLWYVAMLYRHWAVQLLPYSDYVSTTERALRESIKFHEKLSQFDPQRSGVWLSVADRNVVLGYMLWCTGRSELAEAAFQRAIEIFDEHESEIAADKHPSRASEINTISVWLAYYLACTHRDDKAAEFGRKAALSASRLTDPTEAAYALFQTAIVQVRLGAHTGYRETCTALVDVPIVRADDSTKARAILTWCLAPNALEDLSLPVKRAEELAAHNSFDRPHVVPYILGAALYRVGKYEGAAVQLEKSIAVHLDNLNINFQRLFLAMTKWQLGQRAEARRLLAEIQSAIDPKLNSLSTPFNDRLCFEFLLREAEALIEPNEADEAVENVQPIQTAPTTDN
ncbi:MAG TPA: serine/threonine-protein kinase [Lacipirellulaceae bacterium]|nr:serine/threonine-protein kinase [Lacipirellulaceae bacterium]